MIVSGWPHGDPDAVVRAVLAQRAFDHMATSGDRAGGPSPWALLWEWFVQHVIHPLFAPFAHAVAASRGIGTAFGVALLAFAFAALVVACVRLALRFATPRRGLANSAGVSKAASREQSSLQWRTLGMELAARGEHARAVAAFFAAALAALDERNVVSFERARTPGEYRRLVRRACAAAAPPFDDLSERFSRAAYGAAALQADDAMRAERALAAFEPALPA